MTHRPAVQRVAECLNAAPLHISFRQTPDPPETPRTPADIARDRELGYRLDDACSLARKSAGVVTTWCRD